MNSRKNKFLYFAFVPSAYLMFNKGITTWISKLEISSWFDSYESTPINIVLFIGWAILVIVIILDKMIRKQRSNEKWFLLLSMAATIYIFERFFLTNWTFHPRHPDFKYFDLIVVIFLLEMEN
jgi:hypothetical protein